jgi:hypothetical protein
MRRIILSRDQHVAHKLSPEASVQSKAKVADATSDRRLREKRSSRYMEALRILDAGHLAVGTVEYNSLIEAIREELPDPDALVGVVAKCYLGPPFEVHTLDLAGGIIEHYPPYKVLPASLERARALARHDEYAFVEVYLGKMVVIRADGSASIVK